MTNLGMQLGLGAGHIVLDGDQASPPPKEHSPQLSVHSCCGQMVAWIKKPLGTELGLGPGDCVRWGSPPPNFSVHVYCGQTARWNKVVLGTEIDLRPGDLVLDGDHAPLPKKGRSPHKFSVHVYCGQTTGWIKIALDMEVGLSPGDGVRWGPSPSQKGGGAPSLIFCPCLSWPNGCMDQVDATWYGRRSRPRRHCVRCGPRSHSP